MKKPRKTPTLKQKLFAKAYVKHRGNGAKAALEVYDTNKRDARNVAHITLKKAIVQKEIKQQLEEAGLGVEDLNKYTLKLIDKNLDGKPSQAVAASMVQLAYKLHNIMPASKKMNVNLNLNDQVGGKDFDEVKKMLEEQNKMTQALLASVEGKK